MAGKASMTTGSEYFIIGSIIVNYVDTYMYDGDKTISWKKPFSNNAYVTVMSETRANAYNAKLYIHSQSTTSVTIKSTNTSMTQELMVIAIGT